MCFLGLFFSLVCFLYVWVRVCVWQLKNCGPEEVDTKLLGTKSEERKRKDFLFLFLKNSRLCTVKNDNARKLQLDNNSLLFK